MAVDGHTLRRFGYSRKSRIIPKTSHVKRTRHAHQVIALSILLHNAYDTYVCEESEPMPFDEWCTERIEASPQFQYWLIVMQLELLVLVYVRSLRDANFLLYVAVLVNEVTAVFSTLSTNPSSFNDDFMCILETYVVLLYDRTCTETTVDSARKHIFYQSKPYNQQTVAAHETGIKWTCVGTGTCPYSRTSFAKGMRVAKEFHAKMGTAVHCCQKQWHRVLNCYAAGARKCVEDSANVSELL